MSVKALIMTEVFYLCVCECVSEISTGSPWYVTLSPEDAGV